MLNSTGYVVIFIDLSLLISFPVLKVSSEESNKAITERRKTKHE